MNKPKILIISPACNLGGGEIYLQNLLPYLLADYDVTLLGPRFAKKLFSAQVKAQWLPLFPKSLDKLLVRTHKIKKIYYRLLFTLFRNLKQYDLVNLQWFDGALIEAIKVRPIVLTLHTGFLIPRQHDAYVARLLNDLDRTICVSQAARGQLVERGVDTSKCTVIHNAVDSKKFAFSATPGSHVTWIGRVEAADKNPQLFVDIAAAASAQKLPYKFRLVGAGAALAAIKAKCPPNLELTGFQSPEQMAKIYKEASILCMTSTSEGLPLTALEAMASGVPVVATAVGGLTDLLLGGAGVLADKPAAESMLGQIDSLLQNPDRYEQIRRTARAKIEKQYSIDQLASDTKQVYDELISGAKR